MTELPEREDFGDYGAWPGRAVLDPTGRRLGEVREIYLDDATDRPEWVLVALGDEDARYVPLADASVTGDAITVAQDSERIEAAPVLEPSKELSQEQERRLYSHYGLRYSGDESDSLLPVADEPGPEPEPEPAPQAAAEPEPESVPEPAPQAAAEPEPEVVAVPVLADAEPEPAPASAAAQPPLSVHAGAGAELPPPGETSEPEDRGPMIPPRPEPVAPPPPPPPPPPPEEPGGPLALVRRKPVPVAAGVAGVVAAIVLILLRRR
jgi:hypothetical protein